MSSIRRQATLYLPAPDAEIVEALRERFNPAQFGLIAAHVTLCREDEVDDWRALSSRLVALGPLELTLRFAAPVREGNLVTLPAIGATGELEALRSSLLAKSGQEPRRHQAHLTLVHPRNGRCSDQDFAEIERLCRPFSTTLRTVTLIEQVDGGPWAPFLPR